MTKEYVGRQWKAIYKLNEHSEWMRKRMYVNDKIIDMSLKFSTDDISPYCMKLYISNNSMKNRIRDIKNYNIEYIDDKEAFELLL